MHTETLILNSMQQQHYLSHLNHDHLVPDPQQQQQHHQQQIFTHLPSTRATTNTSSSPTSLNTQQEGLYNPTSMTPQQHLTSECPSQYYTTTNATAVTASASRLVGPNNPCTSSSSSSSSSSSNSSTTSNDSSNSSYTCPNVSAKNNTSIGVNLRVTGQCSQGGRKYMEDYFSVAYQQSENAKDLEYAFIGIYDGHGGAEAAKFAKEHLMMKIINQRLFWSDNDHDVLRAIREGYIATHYAMWREQDKWPKTANGLPSTAGTTATVAFIRREKIYIGHVGDSGIVLGYQNENENFWRAKQLTTDHKPESVEERTRIMNSGGKVVVKSGVPRVVWNRPRNASHRGPIRKKTLIDEIPFLAVARSLGDLWSYNSERNEFVVSPDPDVKVIPINPKTFRCLIFGTDGLWNVVNAQEAVNTVRDNEVINERLVAQRGEDGPHEGNQWTNPSKSLVAQALRTWSNKKMRADNTSVVTVILYPPGQGDHNNTEETVCRVANPPEFVQPVSYGLEYSQVQAEVHEYDDATTYKEMALKYLPPEAYRNFDYYADDDSDTEGEEESEEEEQEVITKTIKPPAGDLQQNANYCVNFEQTNVWNWQNNNNQHHLQTLGQQNEEVEEEEELEEEDDDEDDEEEVEEEVEELTVPNNERPLCIVNYQNYVHLEAEETNNATDSYINTFAESYNSILTASQDDCIKANSSNSTTSSPSSSSNSNSNSNSYCQSVSQFELELEQQLYQQQCMSEEEGYSLTKLETRREQQTCKTLQHRTETTTAVQTFKIFPEPNTNQTQHIEVYHQSQSTESYYHHPHHAGTTHNEPQQFITNLHTPKPLELHSLLQQEREEEQQVAYERLQMEQQHQNIAAYACLQGASTTQNTIETVAASLEDAVTEEVEYLEEEVEELEEIIEPDTTVQINEISSSSTCVEESSALDADDEVVLETIEKIEILPHNIKQTEDKEKEVLLQTKYHNTPLKISKNSICLETKPQTSSAATLALNNTPLKPNLKRGRACNSSSYLYANENLQRISNTKNQHSLYAQTNKRTATAMTVSTPAEKRRRSMCMTPGLNMTPPNATSTPMLYQRQLRSTTTTTSSTCTPNAGSSTPIMDYGKRTLRTRNSLAKDLKAKSALKFSHNAVTRNFLRTTAANLMSGKPLLLNEQHLTTCNRRTLNGSAHSSRPNNRSTIKTRREKPGVTINGSLNQNKTNLQHTPHPPHLNLRSRQTSGTNSNVATSNTSNLNSLRSPPPPPSPVAASTPVIKRASLTERRILRSMHTRSSSSKGSQTPAANFSKSTRTQSTGSNLAAPPPSPKLINAAAAVAAATRARSLLNAKHAAATNGTQSVVAAVFGKRSSLRSNGSSHPAVLPAVSSATTAASSTSPPASTTHQTLRGRIVKKR